MNLFNQNGNPTIILDDDRPNEEASELEQEEQALRTKTPCWLTLLNAPSPVQRDIEDYLGISINNLDATATLSDKCTVNFVHFTVDGTVAAGELIERINSAGSRAKLIHKNSHLQTDKSREIFIRKITPVSQFKEVSEWKELASTHMAAWGVVIDVVFWTERNYITITFEDYDLVQNWPADRSVTIDGVNYPTFRYSYVEIQHPSEVIVEGFNPSDMEQITSLIREVGDHERIELFTRGGRSGAIIRMHSLKANRELLNLPNHYTRPFSDFKIEIHWSKAVDANTKAIQPKANFTPSKEKSSSNNLTGRITALQNHIKRSEESGVRELKRIEARMETENNKTRLAMISMITESSRLVHQSMTNTFSHVMETQLEMHRSSGNIQSLEHDLSNTNLMIAIHQLNPDPAVREIASQHIAQRQQIMVNINEEKKRQQEYLQSRMTQISSITGQPNHAALLTCPLVGTANTTATQPSTPVPVYPTGHAPTIQTPHVNRNPKRRVVRVEVAPNEEHLKAWLQAIEPLEEIAVQALADLTWAELEKDFVNPTLIHIGGSWLFRAAISTIARKVEVLSILQSFALAFKSAPQATTAEHIINEAGAGINLPTKK